MKLFKRIAIITALAWVLLSMVAPITMRFYSNKTVNSCSAEIRHAYPGLNYLRKVPDKLLLFTDRGKAALRVYNYLDSRNFKTTGMVITSFVCLNLLIVMFTEDREKE